MMLLVGTVIFALANEFGIECDKSKPTDKELLVKFDFFASEFGYYEVEGCQGASPNLILAASQEYTFVQSHISNWNHPLGFAYLPDGAKMATPSTTTMDHSQHKMATTNTTIDHSQHKMATTTTAMDHSQHKMATTTTAMDHSQHKMTTAKTTMDHSQHKMGTSTMSRRKLNTGITKMGTRKPMDHGQHDMAGTTTMDHSNHKMAGTTMGHSQHKMGDCIMDHSNHHMHKGSALTSTLGPTTCKEGMQKPDACVISNTCDTPLYSIGNKPPCESEYFNAFRLPIARWYDDRDQLPRYQISLKVVQESTTELFYFCHFHTKVSGKISICDRGKDGKCTKRPSTTNTLFEELSEFDTKCGTANVGDFADAKGKGGKCEGLEFLCGKSDQVSKCFEAIDCAMNHGMRVEYPGASGRLITFMRQMIPHHQNAVNMAKIVMKQETCDAGKDEEFDNLLRTVITGQNGQIQYMQNYLEDAKVSSVQNSHCDLSKASMGVKGLTSPKTNTANKDDVLRGARCIIMPSPGKSFTEIEVGFDYYASEFGYFVIDGCEGASPHLILAAEHEYRFIQQDITNYYHPLGFAYDLDGAILDNPELEPEVDPSGSKCAPHCQHPKYYKGDQYLGGETGDGGWGLDMYEPDFASNLDDWSGGGALASTHKWQVRLTITDPVTPEAFYFCHVHGGLSGRVTVCDWDIDTKKCTERKNVDKTQGYITDTPVKLYELFTPSAYDQSCGTSSLAPFKPNDGYDKYCKDRVFMCSKEEDYDQFASCFDAVNCAMHHGMKVEYTGNCQELFINQMIPHHQNAVNMAKTTLMFTEDDLVSGDLAIPCSNDPESKCPDLETLGMLRSIIQGQNAQIQYMRDYLSSIEGARESPLLCTSKNKITPSPCKQVCEHGLCRQVCTYAAEYSSALGQTITFASTILFATIVATLWV